jgi:hypothetical protein
MVGGGEDVADLDVAVGDKDTVKQECDECSPRRKGRRVQTVADLGAQCLPRPGDRTQGAVLLCPCVEGPLLARESLLATGQLAWLASNQRHGENAGQRGIAQALLGSGERRQGMVQGRLASWELLGQPLPSRRTA